MLLALRNYIQRLGRVSNVQLAKAHQMELATLEPMLTFLISKNIIFAVSQKPRGCAMRCQKCHETDVVFYSPIIQ
ncbi:MAG: FeoC-like transcriptional regulator [Legionellaceae bacterium]|nr:FeoC-like transcriptional regulator [Legionellaceae bacterium]